MTEGKVRISQEKRDKRYIKEELMRYHLYHDQLQKAENDIAEFKYKYHNLINDPPIGGSIIKLPDGTPNNSNMVIRLEGELADMRENKRAIEKQIAHLDSWLSALTQAQYRAVLIYVCEYQCQERAHAALDIPCTEEALKDIVERAINRIYTKFYKNAPSGE